jgi:S1-C subfamily serine protease
VIRRRRREGTLILAAFGLLCALAGALILLILMPGGARQAPAFGVIEAPPEPTGAPATLSDLAAKWSGSVAEVEVDYQAGRRVRTTEQGNGSGVYVDPRGFFLTNYHVIEDTLEVRVRLPDGEILKVLNSAYDRTYDVAVLYTGPVEGLAAVEAGASGALRVGDPVFAIGYPRVGDDVLPGTLTTGVVSGLGRLDVTAGNISPDVGLIQIDAAINAGNSGGALFDMKGKLVGIPTMKIASGYGGESFEGLAFAIPIDVARPVAARLMDEILAKETQGQ